MPRCPYPGRLERRHTELPAMGACMTLSWGCAAKPVVTYEKAPQHDVKGLQKFSLAHSLIKVDYRRTDNKITGKAEVTGISVVTVPTDGSASTQRADVYVIRP